MLGKYIVELVAKGYDIRFETSTSEGSIEGNVIVSVTRMNKVIKRYISKYDLAAINIPTDDFFKIIIDKLVNKVDNAIIEEKSEKKNITKSVNKEETEVEEEADE